MNTNALRSLPQIDTILRAAEGNPALTEYSDVQIANAARAVIDGIRADILSDNGGQVDGTIDTIIIEIFRRLAQDSVHSLRSVINGTGIPLHTNLGRAVMPECVAEQVKLAAMEYTTLEYDVETGGRGSRHSHVESLLCQLTGAQSAMAVNNNAAAVLLALSALCHGREAVVSRGELVEIGGSFRIPEVMEQSGAILREVGSTNKTHLRDYAAAIGENTAALLKVHTSNYRIVGFTAEVGIGEMCELGRQRGVSVIYDVGSGDLTGSIFVGAGSARLSQDTTPRNGRVNPYPTTEPSVREGIAAGADVVLFSGDKLLGGPQAGMAVGRADLIAKMKSHPLARAVRIDKLSLAALEGTLRLYAAGKEGEIPTVAMLSATSEELRERADALVAILPQVAGLEYSVEATMGEVGGGSLPGVELPSWAVAIRPVPTNNHPITIMELEHHLRTRATPIIGRIVRDTYLLDVRCIERRHFAEIGAAMGAVGL